MSNTIQIKRSSTASSVPTAGQLAQGELAVNLVDKKLYTKDNTNTVIQLAAVPAGSVIHIAMNTAPTGYLKANGAAVSRSTYADLFAAIGTTFGAGDGSTTFALPDLRGEFLRGWDDGRGVDSGRAFGTAQLDQMQRITGQAQARRAAEVIGDQQGALFDAGVVSNARVASGTANGQLIGFDSSLSPNARTSATTDGETRPRNVALLACIKF